MDAAATRTTLLFWSAKTTLPWVSKTADNGDPNEPARLGIPLVMPAVAPPPTTVETTPWPAAAASAVGETAMSEAPATTEHATAIAAAWTRPRVRALTGCGPMLLAVAIHDRMSRCAPDCALIAATSEEHRHGLATHGPRHGLRPPHPTLPSRQRHIDPGTRRPPDG